MDRCFRTLVYERESGFEIVAEIPDCTETLLVFLFSQDARDTDLLRHDVVILFWTV